MSFCEVQFIFSPIFLLIVCLFLIDLQKFFVYSRSGSFVRFMHWKYLLSLCGLPFHLLEHYFLINLCLYLFLAMFSFHCCTQGFSSCHARASHCGGSSGGPAALGHTGVCEARRHLQLQLVGSRAQAQQLWYTSQLPHGKWNLPRRGIKLMSPALAGRFLSPGQAGKSVHITNSVF